MTTTAAGLMRSRLLAGVTTTAMCVVATGAFAGGTPPIPVSQARSLLGDSIAFDAPLSQQDFDTMTWPASGAWDVTLDTLAALPGSDATLHADQVTLMTPFGVQGTGSAVAVAEVVDSGALAYSIGSSECAMTFDVVDQRPYRIVALLAAGPNSRTRVVLAGDSGTFVDIVVEGRSQAVDVHGTLAPGRYTFQCSAFASAAITGVGVDADAASFTLHFSTSDDPADLNNDGAVASDDLGILLGAWGPCEACAADLDADGIVDGADLAMLLAAWRSHP